MAHIRTKGLRIEFPLYHVEARSLKRRLMTAMGNRVRTGRHNRVVVGALTDLDIDISSGERVALIGRNGAGKTTLLRTLAGLYEPVAGRLEVSGMIGTLIDPRAGMDDFCTGRENIRLRGLFNRMNAEEIDALEENAAAFAGLGDFLDMPIHSYSAGMQMRLAFAIATGVRPEILLMDEWLSTGDEEFLERAEERLASLINTAEILVLATHDMELARKWCTRAIVLEDGRVVRDGPPAEVLPEISASFRRRNAV